MTKPKRSYLWNFFSTLSDRESIAVCLTCRQSFSYKSTITNMRKHLERRHPDLLGILAQQKKPEVQVNDWGEPVEKRKGRPSRSRLWRYFARVGGGAARCSGCGLLLAYHGSTTSNLRKHLERKHAHTLLLLNDEERQAAQVSQEAEPADDFYEDPPQPESTHQEQVLGQQMEEVFLNDEIFKQEAPNASVQPEKQKSKEPEKHKKKKRRKRSYSTDDEAKKPKRAEHSEESIDIFAQYISSLLKKLPQSVANRLQIEFVTKIINAKMEYDRLVSHDGRIESSLLNGGAMLQQDNHLLNQTSLLNQSEVGVLHQNGTLMQQNSGLLTQDSMVEDQPKYLITVTAQDRECAFETTQ